MHSAAASLLESLLDSAAMTGRALQQRSSDYDLVLGSGEKIDPSQRWKDFNISE
jgi:hypothetical protein